MSQLHMEASHIELQLLTVLITLSNTLYVLCAGQSISLLSPLDAEGGLLVWLCPLAGRRDDSGGDLLPAEATLENDERRVLFLAVSGEWGGGV